MEISLDSIKKTIISILERFHVIIFTIFAAGSLIVVMFMLNVIIQDSSSDNTTLPAQSGFDQATIDKVNSLRSSDEPAEPLNLSGRTNPFVE